MGKTFTVFVVSTTTMKVSPQNKYLIYRYLTTTIANVYYKLLSAGFKGFTAIMFGRYLPRKFAQRNLLPIRKLVKSPYARLTVDSQLTVIAFSEKQASGRSFFIFHYQKLS